MNDVRICGCNGGRWSGEGSPAVRTVFFIDSIMRLSPEACRRTLVRSSGLRRREGKALELGGVGDRGKLTGLSMRRLSRQHLAGEDGERHSCDQN